MTDLAHDADTRWLTPVELGAWRRLSIVMNQLPTRLDRALQPHGLTFFEYMILAMLSDAPDHRLSMGRLASLTAVSPSRLSHAARRLEERGLIAREPADHDRRVTLAELRPEGRTLLVAAAPDHVAAVHDLVFAGLDDDEVTRFGATLATILDAVAPQVAPPWDEDGDW